MWKPSLATCVIVAVTIRTVVTQPLPKGHTNAIRSGNELKQSRKGFPYEISNEIPQEYGDRPNGARLNNGPEKSVGQTVHGSTESEAPGESTMSPEDKSMHGCMGTMWNSNRNKHVPLSEPEMKSACQMYAQWGRSMREEPRWHPTAGQMDWWTSLGAKSGRRRGQGSRSPRQSGVAKARRREYRVLSDTERRDFHEAVRHLKNSAMDGSSKYDLFVNFHQGNVAPGAHFGPGFFGYHRELLHRFESALREINPRVALPYWDSNLDNHLGDDLAQVSMLWTPRFLGDGKGEVRSGPFAYWSLPHLINGRWTLHRNLTVSPPTAQTEPALIPDRAIDMITSARSLRDLSWFVDPTFERHHGATHNWVGGVMGDLPNSPADPVFFLHHAFIDCLWEQMRSRQRFRKPFVDPRFDYPNDSAALGVGILQPDGRLLDDASRSNHFSLNTLRPFGPLRNIDGLRNEYFDEFYTCEPSPRCSVEAPSCGTPYLFCDLVTHRCAPRLQPGADCSRFSASDPCYGSTCCSGECREKCPGQSASGARSKAAPEERQTSQVKQEERPHHRVTSEERPESKDRREERPQSHSRQDERPDRQNGQGGVQQDQLEYEEGTLNHDHQSTPPSQARPVSPTGQGGTQHDRREHEDSIVGQSTPLSQERPRSRTGQGGTQHDRHEERIVGHDRQSTPHSQERPRSPTVQGGTQHDRREHDERIVGQSTPHSQERPRSHDGQGERPNTRNREEDLSQSQNRPDERPHSPRGRRVDRPNRPEESSHSRGGLEERSHIPHVPQGDPHAHPHPGHEHLRPRVSPRFGDQATFFSIGSEFPQDHGFNPYQGPRRSGNFNYFRSPRNKYGPFAFPYRPFG